MRYNKNLFCSFKNIKWYLNNILCSFTLYVKHAIIDSFMIFKSHHLFWILSLISFKTFVCFNINNIWTLEVRSITTHLTCNMGGIMCFESNKLLIELSWEKYYLALVGDPYYMKPVKSQQLLSSIPVKA
jgi:hypothetical protein